MNRIAPAFFFALCGGLFVLVSPSVADTVVSIDTTQDGGIFTVTDETVLLVTHSSNDPTLTLTNSAAANFAGATVIGSLTGESGHLEIFNGSTLNNSGTVASLETYGSEAVYRGSGYIGLNSGSTGTVTVSGGGSMWDGVVLYVGNSGDGTLLVEAGGAVTNFDGSIGGNSGSTGTATVTGDGSTWGLSGRSRLSVGNSGDGTLLVEAGGVVTSRGGSIGSNIGSTGLATVTGVGSTWGNSQSLYVGEYGVGTLLVGAGGAAVTSKGGSIGRENGSNGTATVTGAGSMLEIGSIFYVGRTGNGTLRVEAGGAVTNRDDGFIGVGSGSSGAVTVTGTDSNWTNNSDLILGGSSLTGATTGTGSLRVAEGGEVEVTGTTRIHDGGGAVLATGGTLITRSLDATGGGEFLLGGGELRLMGGSLELDSTLDVSSGSRVSGTGGILLDVKNSGIISPGLSPGTLLIDGDYIQSLSGLLEIEIGGLLPGIEHDVLQVSGQVTLAGLVSILLDGYTPALGDSFQILEIGSPIANNGFSFDFSGASLDPDLFWDTNQFLSTGALSISDAGVIPEPGRAMLLATGLLLLLSRRGRRC